LEVIPPLVSIDIEKFNGSFVSLTVLVIIPSVDALASVRALVIFKVNTPFEKLWKIIVFASRYGFLSVYKSSYDVYCHQVVVLTQRILCKA
jgi:hypothetical protein